MVPESCIVPTGAESPKACSLMCTLSYSASPSAVAKRIVRLVGAPAVGGSMASDEEPLKEPTRCASQSVVSRRVVFDQCELYRAICSETASEPRGTPASGRLTAAPAGMATEITSPALADMPANAKLSVMTPAPPDTTAVTFHARAGVTTSMLASPGAPEERVNPASESVRLSGAAGSEAARVRRSVIAAGSVLTTRGWKDTAGRYWRYEPHRSVVVMGCAGRFPATAVMRSVKVTRFAGTVSVSVSAEWGIVTREAV